MKVKAGLKFECSRRRISANNGLVSINNDLEVGEGYDGMLYPFGCGDLSAPWTPEERRELADYMIALWNKFADQEIP